MSDVKKYKEMLSEVAGVEVKHFLLALSTEDTTSVVCSGTFSELAPNLVDLQIAIQKIREGTWNE